MAEQRGDGGISPSITPICMPVYPDATNSVPELMSPKIEENQECLIENNG